jgi:hypothetical protein
MSTSGERLQATLLRALAVLRQGDEIEARRIAVLELLCDADATNGVCTSHRAAERLGTAGNGQRRDLL